MAALRGVFEVGSFPRGIAFGGTSIWVASFGAASLTKLRICFDDTYTLTANSSGATVSKLRASDGVLVATFLHTTHPGMSSSMGETYGY